MPNQDSNACNRPLERKINPLGKPNKKFLGRTINNALRHNKRAIERTQAKCQQKLQELDYKHERRKGNVFYNRKITEEFGGSTERKNHSRNTYKITRNSRSSSREYCSRSHSYIKKHKKKKKKTKRRHRRRSTSSEPKKLATFRSDFIHSNSLALAVAMAYNRPLYQTAANKPSPSPSPSSPLSDIVKELMSDDETAKQGIQLDELIMDSSNNEIPAIVTIDVSSQDESVDSTATGGESETSSSPGNISCITLVDSESDLEIIENNVEQPKGGCSPVAFTELSIMDEVRRTADITLTVDLTED